MLRTVIVSAFLATRVLQSQTHHQRRFFVFPRISVSPPADL
jgi:hypothetical protein